MTVSAQIAIYPLRQERLTPAVRAVSEALAVRGLTASVGPMSTLVAGDLDAVVDGLTLSNACPAGS
jgi:uncharacterized protein YqgV (UPF0045/DUF77 family)